jgi:hypothetical protein
MSTTHRAIAIAYLLGVFFLCLWVPWRVPTPQQAEPSLRAPYSYLWSGPKLKRGTPPSNDLAVSAALAKVDTQRLALTLLAVTALAGIAFLLVPPKHQHEAEDDPPAERKSKAGIR